MVKPLPSISKLTLSKATVKRYLLVKPLASITGTHLSPLAKPAMIKAAKTRRFKAMRADRMVLTVTSVWATWYTAITPLTRGAPSRALE